MLYPSWHWLAFPEKQVPAASRSVHSTVVASGLRHASSVAPLLRPGMGPGLPGSGIWGPGLPRIGLLGPSLHWRWILRPELALEGGS